MNLRSLLTFKSLGIVVLGLLLVLICLMMWKVHQYETLSEGDALKYEMFFNRYKI